MKFCYHLLLLLLPVAVPALSALSVPPTAASSPNDFLGAPAARYVCPMHPHIGSDHPRQCPICGMDLVAREQPPAEATAVVVSGAMQQAMALTTEVAQRTTLWRFIKTYGAVQFDETGLSHIHPRASGWIENLTVNSVGQRVKRGELLYQVYAPELIQAQEDFLSLLSASQQSAPMAERGQRRLQLLGLSEELIAQLAKTRQVRYRVPYYAQQDAIVSALAVREGMYVEASNRIMTLADLSRVWVVADIFAHQLDWVRVGQSVELDLPALNLFRLEGQVEFVYPTLDPVTRTLQVRVALDNPQQRLKPHMFATVRIYGGPVEALNVPLAALIQTAKHNRLLVQSSATEFERREVTVGIITNGRAEILQGLAVGEKVVTSGQFLLDAEASLSNLAVGGQAAPHAHQH